MSVQAFDTSIGNNFTNDACPTFMDDFTTNKTFQDCNPMSFYLQNSQSYAVQTRKGLKNTEKIIDRSCNVNFDKCRKIMHDLSNELMKKCKEDYDLQNPLVTQAYRDFISYSMIHKATCLKVKNNTVKYSNSTKNRPKYCYTKALFAKNASDNLDAYLYNLPYGQQYPGTSNVSSSFKLSNGSEMTASCSQCTHDVMHIFHANTANDKLPIVDTYVDAARRINKHCGGSDNDFVNETINSSGLPKMADNSSDASSTRAALRNGLFLMIIVHLFLQFLT